VPYQGCNNGKISRIERSYKGREKDDSNIPEDSRYEERSSTREGPPERDPFPAAFSP